MTSQSRYILAMVVLILQSAVWSQKLGEGCTDNRTRKPGICKLPNDCPGLSSKGSVPTICNFQFGNAVVCCEGADNKPPLQPNDNSLLYPEGGFIFPDDEEEDQQQTDTRTISERKCAEYSKGAYESVVILPLLTIPDPTRVNFSKCNYDGTPLIVGGKPASPGEFPFMAAIGYADGAFKCGGTLISENFVVSAAHCARRSKPTKVRLGSLTLNSKDAREIGVSRVIMHPGYRPPRKYNDICLLKLARPVEFTQFIHPACIYSKSTIKQPKAIALGWGTTSFGGENSNGLLKVSLDLLNILKCRATYEVDKKHLPNGVVDSMLCAGDLKGFKDTCQGDSGGPLVVTQPDNNCVHHVIGITSFGITCAAANTPAIYTKVSDYVPWIERIVWP